jgi:hypothetical protein
MVGLFNRRGERAMLAFANGEVDAGLWPASRRERGILMQ